MNRHGLQLVWNSLSAHANRPNLGLQHRIASLGILRRSPTWRGNRAGRRHRLWYSQSLCTAPLAALTCTSAASFLILSRLTLPVSLFYQHDQTPEHPSSPPPLPPPSHHHCLSPPSQRLYSTMSPSLLAPAFLREVTNANRSYQQSQINLLLSWIFSCLAVLTATNTPSTCKQI